MRDRILPVTCSFSENGQDLELLLLQSFRLFLEMELNMLNSPMLLF